MINQKCEICKAFATGLDKYPHNNDPKTCIMGRKDYIRNLPPEKQIKQLVIYEQLSPEMGEYINKLAKERKRTPLEILEEEGMEV
jgi:hypothetical protein